MSSTFDFWTSTSSLTGLRVGLEPLVVVVHRDGDLALGDVLADDVLIEVPLDLGGGAGGRRCPSSPASDWVFSRMMSRQSRMHSEQM
jgi:hypothetical protein